MKCFLDFMNDRTCDLCREVKYEMYSECRLLWRLRRENSIKKRCLHCTVKDEWRGERYEEELQEICYCKKSKSFRGYCEPDKNCLKYIKQID